MSSKNTRNLARLHEEGLVQLRWSVKGDRRSIEGARDNKDKELMDQLKEFKDRVNELAAQYRGELTVRVIFEPPTNGGNRAKRKSR